MSAESTTYAPQLLRPKIRRGRAGRYQLVGVYAYIGSARALGRAFRINGLETRWSDDPEPERTWRLRYDADALEEQNPGYVHADDLLYAWRELPRENSYGVRRAHGRWFEIVYPDGGDLSFVMSETTSTGSWLYPFRDGGGFLPVGVVVSPRAWDAIDWQVWALPDWRGENGSVRLLDGAAMKAEDAAPVNYALKLYVGPSSRLAEWIENWFDGAPAAFRVLFRPFLVFSGRGAAVQGRCGAGGFAASARISDADAAEDAAAEDRVLRSIERKGTGIMGVHGFRTASPAGGTPHYAYGFSAYPLERQLLMIPPTETEVEGGAEGDWRALVRHVQEGEKSPEDYVPSEDGYAPRDLPPGRATLGKAELVYYLLRSPESGDETVDQADPQQHPDLVAIGAEALALRALPCHFPADPADDGLWQAGAAVWDPCAGAWVDAHAAGSRHRAALEELADTAFDAWVQGGNESNCRGASVGDNHLGANSSHVPRLALDLDHLRLVPAPHVRPSTGEEYFDPADPFTAAGYHFTVAGTLSATRYRDSNGGSLLGAVIANGATISARSPGANVQTLVQAQDLTGTNPHDALEADRLQVDSELRVWRLVFADANARFVPVPFKDYYGNTYTILAAAPAAS